MTFSIEKLSLAKWDDFVSLMSMQNGTSKCWCMYLRIPGSVYSAQWGDGNKQSMYSLLEQGKNPGLIGYVEGKPAAWCALGARNDFPRLRRMTAEIDQLVCSIPCLYVARPFRGNGLAGAIVGEACETAKAWGYSVVEAYPFECPPGKKLSLDSSMFGTVNFFSRLGFVEVSQPTKSRRVVRKTI